MNKTITRFECIDGFAEELDEIIYEGISNCCGILSYRHSVENGKKYTQFWYGALLQGFLSEMGPTANKYWHAQAPVMCFGKKLPLHIIFLYPFTIYVCTLAVQRLQLNICTEPAAIGLLVMLMEIPFRMISVKFLHITYHDTEPLFFYKLCGVPWTEIFASLLFATSYVAIYHGAKFYYSRDISTIWDREDPDKKETLFVVLSGLLSPIAAFIQKLILFHFLHDFFNVNPISCLFFTVCLYMSFVLCFEPRRGEKHVTEDSTAKTYLFYQISLYFACLLFLALFGRPQNEVSIGSHEPTGDCTTLVCSKFPLGKPTKRKKYLCADEVAARKNFVYNFECLEEGPPCLSAVWYTICGSPICNRFQFFLNIFSLALLVCSIFSKILFSDVKKMEIVKRLIVKLHLPVDFTREERAGRHTSEPVAPQEEEEVTVGYVLVQLDPLSTKCIPKKIQ
ncbi:hypothetical protein RUM44_002580 [Polyplax serrata]|uniref:DUF7802 domain-containing protein n=1 Tax=Polyplax serrata TaxID=468196 RepID=A0ABR1AF57_POLSC